MTARRRIRRSALTTPCIGVAPLCAPRFPSIAPPCAWWRVSNPPQINGNPLQIAHVCQSSRANSQESRKIPLPITPGMARTPGRRVARSTTPASQARPDARSIAICDRFRNCVTNEGERRALRQNPRMCHNARARATATNARPGLLIHSPSPRRLPIFSACGYIGNLLTIQNRETRGVETTTTGAGVVGVVNCQRQRGDTLFRVSPVVDKLTDNSCPRFVNQNAVDS